MSDFFLIQGGCIALIIRFMIGAGSVSIISIGKGLGESMSDFF